MQWYVWLIIIVSVLLLICFIIGFLVWNMAIPTKRPETYRNKPTDDPVEIQMRDFEEKVERSLRYMNLEDCWIKSHDGLNLHAYYRESPIKTNTVIISVHGWHGEGLRTSAQFSHFFVDFTYNVLQKIVFRPHL